MEYEIRSERPGVIDGRHYSAFATAVRQLKRSGRLDEAIQLLLRLISATEAESAAEQCGVAPWYYEQLAIIYSKQRRPKDELDVLLRYEAQRKAPGIGPAKLAQRLERVRRESVSWVP